MRLNRCLNLDLDLFFDNCAALILAAIHTHRDGYTGEIMKMPCKAITMVHAVLHYRHVCVCTMVRTFHSFQTENPLENPIRHSCGSLILFTVLSV